MQLVVTGGARSRLLEPECRLWASHLTGLLFHPLHPSLPTCGMGRELGILTSQLPDPTLTSLGLPETKKPGPSSPVKEQWRPAHFLRGASGSPGGAQGSRIQEAFPSALQSSQSPSEVNRQGMKNGNQATGPLKWEFHLPDFVLLDLGFYGNLRVERWTA